MTDKQNRLNAYSRLINTLTSCDILIALLFALAIVLSLGFAGVFGPAWRSGSSGTGAAASRALISVDGAEYVYSLSENRTIELTGAEGPAVLVIEDGTIRFEDSTCRDLTCVNMGKVGPDAAHFAACLPNKIIVTLDEEKQLAGEDDDALDW